MTLVEVYICQLPENRSKAELNLLLEHFPVQRRNYILRFFHLEDAYRSMIGDLLLNHVLRRRTGMRLRDIKLGKNAFGKPFLTGCPQIQYNISHSGDYVVCAVHDQEVGVDIEKVQVFDLRMAKHFFNGDEYRDTVRADDMNLTCYEVWTMKESYIKALGEGLSIPLQSFRMKCANANYIEVIDMEKDEIVPDFICKQLTSVNDYRLAVCAKGAAAEDISAYPDHVGFDQLCDNVI